jgi:hypothetical protein
MSYEKSCVPKIWMRFVCYFCFLACGSYKYCLWSVLFCYLRGAWQKHRPIRYYDIIIRCGNSSRSNPLFNRKKKREYSHLSLNFNLYTHLHPCSFLHENRSSEIFIRNALVWNFLNGDLSYPLEEKTIIKIKCSLFSSRRSRRWLFLFCFACFTFFFFTFWLINISQVVWISLLLPNTLE